MADITSENQLRMKAAFLNLLYAIIRRELSRNDSSNTLTTKPNRCPRCGKTSAIKRGHDSTGKQRYQCKECKRSYTTVTGSEFSSTNLSLETWMVFAECYVDKDSLRTAAKRCNVSLKTAFHMRKRLSRTINRYSLQVKKALSTEHNQMRSALRLQQLGGQE